MIPDKRRTLASSFRGPVASYICGTVCNGAIVRTTPLLTVLFVLRLFVDPCQRVCSVRAIPGILCFVSPVRRSVCSPKECIALSRGSFPAISGSLVFASIGHRTVVCVTPKGDSVRELLCSRTLGRGCTKHSTSLRCDVGLRARKSHRERSLGAAAVCC